MLCRQPHKSGRLLRAPGNGFRTPETRLGTEVMLDAKAVIEAELIALIEARATVLHNADGVIPGLAQIWEKWANFISDRFEHWISS